MNSNALRAVIVFSALGTSCNCEPKVEDPIPEDAAERYARTVCEAYERCGCVGEGYEAYSVDECLSQSEATFHRVAGWPGMEFDLECFEQVLEELPQDECAAEGPALSCLVFTGGREHGATCTPHWDDWRSASPGLLAAGQCEGGLDCRTGTCGASQYPLVPQGEPCHLELGVACEQGTYCGPDGICHPRATVGEPCDTPGACQVGEFCEGLTQPGAGAGTCRARRAEGSSCDPEEIESCEYPGFCSSDGRCESHWPGVCFYGLTPPRDFFNAADWIPTRSQ